MSFTIVDNPLPTTFYYYVLDSLILIFNGLYQRQTVVFFQPVITVKIIT